MKYSKTLLLISLLFISFSCSDDNEERSDAQTTIPGNNLALGQSAHDLLANDIFENIEIEVVYPEGFSPQANTLNALTSFLEARTFKNNIEIITRQVAAPQNNPYTIEEIRSFENNNRTSFNTENTISVFVFFANGDKDGNEENQVTLGTAYQNTSVVIYEKTINDFASNLGAPNKFSIEITTLTHEFGHLFGLVNIGSEAQNNHEDPDAEAHCITDGCLMRAQAEFAGGVMGMLGNGIPDLGPECVLDLQANGGK